MTERRDEDYIVKVQTGPWRAGGAKDVLLKKGKWTRLKMDAMKTLGSAKSKMKLFFLRIRELFRSMRTKLHASLLRISMAVPLMELINNIDRLPCRITLARKRVINRFHYPCKFALFRRIPTFWIQGNRLVAI